MEIFAQLLFALLRGIIAIFQFFHIIDKKLSLNSRVGKSPMQQEHHDSVDEFMSSWFVFCLAMSMLVGGIGYGVYRIMTRS